jgi:hypothetical protein
VSLTFTAVEKSTAPFWIGSKLLPGIWWGRLSLLYTCRTKLIRDNKFLQNLFNTKTTDLNPALFTEAKAQVQIEHVLS